MKFIDHLIITIFCVGTILALVGGVAGYRLDRYCANMGYSDIKFTSNAAYCVGFKDGSSSIVPVPYEKIFPCLARDNGRFSRNVVE